MSIRKRTWQSRKGEQTAWLVDYRDGEGKRRNRAFKRKHDADNFAATTRIQISEGTHIPDRASITVREAGELWLQSSTAAGLEPTTVQTYAQHLNLHIAPFIGREKLSKLTTPFVRAFADKLHLEGRSAAMVRGIIGSLGAILAEAQERGLVVRNAVRELRTRRRRGQAHRSRHNGKLKVGVEIPAPDEVRSLLSAATGKHRVLLLTAVFTGLRASELRGLRWQDVDLKRGELHVRQRADRRNVIGRPKSAAGERSVPMPPALLSALRDWKLHCPMRDGRHGLVFPNSAGNVEALGNIVKRGLIPTMLRAGLTSPVLDANGITRRDEQGRPILIAKYRGMHCLRHFFASWCINRKEDGGLALPAKVVQERLGHATIAMTMDRYGHLFPRGDDSSELAAAERLLLG